MIFTIGLVLFFIGIWVAIIWYEPNALRQPRRHHVMANVATLGVLVMLVSLCMLAWRWLP